MEKNFIKVDKWGSCLWGIDETGMLFINEGEGEDLTEEGMPWEENRTDITGVSIIGGVTFPEGTSLAGLFKGCKNMESANLSGMHTEEVIDMSSMFEGCSNLTTLDLSTFDTRKCSNLDRMFAKCAKLSDILLGENFDLKGDGTTDVGDRLAVKSAGKYRRAKVIAAEGFTVKYYENEGRNVVTERKTVPGFRYVIEELMYNAPKNEGSSVPYVFMGWNTAVDGSGVMLQPGTEVTSIDEDVNLYAVWGSVPEIGEVHPIEEFAFGETIPFEVPEIYSANDSMVKGYLEVSPNGEDGTWQAIDHATILPVSCSGWLVRLCAENSVGKSYSNAVRLRIRRAIIDMAGVRWAEEDNMTFDGEPKHVWVEGLPKGLVPEYSNNVATEAGTYTASIDIGYDQDNFNEPLLVREHEWTIKKATYDMSQVHWDHTEDFDYDGTEHTIELVGLPEGVTARYNGNTASNAGVYTATAEFDYDSANYEKPSEVVPCVWEIRRKEIDPSELAWSGYEDFVYDGQPHEVHITNLPEDAEVIYEGAEETPAGKYLATATVSGNYRATGSVECEWEILKATYDMSGIKWDYNGPFGYDGASHSIGLTGVPEGLGVTYRGEAAKAAGDYEAVASFVNPDTHNWFTPEDVTGKWSISKNAVDMSGVKWNYDGPYVYDGTTRKIELTGLPEGVYAEYENASASNAGVYSAHAVLKYDSDNLYAEQPADCQWKILKDRIDVSEVRWDYTDAFTYDGTEHGIYLENIPEGLNVEYQDNVKVETGKYAATATLTPTDLVNFEVPEVSACTWSINRCPIVLDNIEWTDASEFVYDGSEKKVEIISDIGDNLTVDYIYNKEKTAGRYYAKAIFTAVDSRNYKAPEPAGFPWSIAKANYDMDSVIWDYTQPFTYDRGIQCVRLLNVPDGLSISYTNAAAEDAGDYTAIAKFKVADTFNYNSNIPDMTIDWRIDRAEYDMRNVKWQDSRVFSYDGESKEIKLEGLPDGLVPNYTNNIASSSSEYVASVDFDYDAKNYEKPEFQSCRWKIDRSPVDISATEWNYDEAFTYDGTEKTVGLNGIPEGAYAEYSNAVAVQAGTYIAAANIISTDSDNFLPSKVENLTWRIEKGDYDMSHVFWDYDKPFTYDGTVHRIILKGLPEGVFPTYRNNTATDAGSYHATVSFKIADDRNFNVPSFEGCDWEVSKADFDMSVVQWDYNGAFKYTGRMHEVVLRGLPDGVRAVYSGNAGAETGTYTASADLIPYDSNNWNNPRVRDCYWEIERADHEMSAVKWDYDGSKTYNGRPQSVLLEQLPNGVTASYTDNEATEVGTYTARAVLSVTDPKNYNVPSVSDCDWEISPADYNMKSVKWNYVPGQLVYDGTRKNIELTNLPAAVSAVYEGNSAVQAGDYTATAVLSTSDDNFKAPETQTFEWSIEKAEIDMSGVKWDYSSEYTYDGMPKRVEVLNLPDGVSVEYEGNVAVNAGEYSAVARFITDATNYKTPEPMTLNWVVNKANADIKRTRWDYSQAFTYDGEAKAIELVGLPDYIEAVYTGNEATDVGVYTAHATLKLNGSDNYNIPTQAECEWEIIKADYDMSDTRWDGDITYVYDGTEKGLTLVGLPEGITPVCTGNTATDAGEYTASAELRFDEKNYNAPKAPTQTWKISKTSYDMSGVAWDYTEDFIYNGQDRTILLTGLPEGVTASYTGNVARDSGSYEAEATFSYDERNYEKPSFGGCRWRIEMADAPLNSSDVRWNYTGPFVYDGTEKGVAFAEKTIEPSFFEKIRGKVAETVLVGVPEGFEVVYENNTATDAGVYYASAKLINPNDKNYREFTVPECRWEILKAKTDTSNVTWDYENAFTYDGTEKSVQLKNVPDTVKVTYTNNAATGAGEYEALAMLESVDPANYESPKPVNSCWWVIKKAVYDMSGAKWSTNEDFVYSGEENVVSVIGLPDGVTVGAYRGNHAIEAGNYTAEATLDYNNKDNFEAPHISDLKWRVLKKKISTADARWNYDGSNLFVYDGTPKDVKLIGLPEGVDVVYIDNRKINAGSYTARARLTFDTRNCEVEEIPDLKWTIEKANYDTSNVHWSYEKPFEYDGYEKSIVLCNVPKSIDVRYRDNKASGVGTYTAKAYLTYDSENYNAPQLPSTIDWEIIK